MPAAIPYPEDPAQEIRVPADQLKPMLVQMLVKNSLFQFDAETVAERLLEADLRGIPAYGCARILDVLEAINKGDVDPRGRVLTVSETAAMAVLDGSRSAGAVAATRGMQLAVAKAKEVGVGTVAVGNSQPLGAASVYALLAVREGMIGYCITSTGGASLAAPGSTRPAVGNCAMAWAVPLGENKPPLVFDSACGPFSWGKVAWLEKYGCPIPDELLVDREGNATVDPENATMRSPDGARGFGLGLVASVLAGPLAGGKTPLHKTRGPTADDSQHFFQAIDVAQFTGVTQFHGELDRTLVEIRSGSSESSDDGVRVPGDRQARIEGACREHGIPLHVSIAESLKAAATKLRIEVPW